MKTKLACIALAVVTMLSLATVALAAVSTNSPPPNSRGRGGWGCPNGFGRGFMRGDDGSLLTTEAFAQRVDEAIAEGLIDESDRQRLIDLHQWCLENGRFSSGARGPGRGRGMTGGGPGCRWL